MENNVFWICDVGSDFFPPIPRWGPFQTEKEAYAVCADPSSDAHNCVCQVWPQHEVTALALKNKSIPSSLRNAFWEAWWTELESAGYRLEEGL